MNKKVLVTGSGGQLGKTIEELYADNNFGLDFTFVSKTEFDITNEDVILRYFRNNKFHYCINCAAYTNVEQAEKTPEIAFQVNTEGVKNLSQACKETNTILIHISTDYVFDGEKRTPYAPEDATNPINEYGKSKLLGEKHIQEIMTNYFIVRTSWLYSKKHGKNFYKTIIEKAKSGDDLFITDEQIGSPTDAVNLVNYILDLIVQNKTNFGVHHFSDEKPMTWYDFAEQILLENNLKNKTNLVKASNYITFASRPKHSVLLNSK
jgi:dTDP-4-dehydrorhamnose reductase